MTITEIQDLIKFIAKAGVTEVEIEKQDFKITIKSEMPKKKKGLGEAEVTREWIERDLPGREASGVLGGLADRHPAAQ